ncbi:MAG: flagellar hook-basal body complex protein [Acidobacteria bacterium]|nr:flagellar hook-basal body complex protein [Acidobacteriota bacterium]
MNSSIYTLASALIAQEERVAATSQNLANVTTDGYKSVARSIVEARAPGAASAAADPLLGAINASVRLKPAGVEMEQGRLADTHEPFDVAIEGPGLLAVQTPAGVAYTRAGHLAEREGFLVTRDEGYQVLGAAGPIRLTAGPLTIATDGTVGSNGETAGKIRIETFEPTALSPLGGALFTASGAGKAAGSATRMYQGRAEESTVRPLQEVTSLIETQRGFELYEKALNLTLNEVNRQAVTELGSVT